MPRFGRADLLGAFALYDDDPNRINTILERARQGDGGGRAGGGEEAGSCRPTARRSIAVRRRSRRRRRCADDANAPAVAIALWSRRDRRCRACRVAAPPRRRRAAGGRARAAVPAAAARRADAAERLRVVAMRHADGAQGVDHADVLSGLAGDPADKAGLAQFVADLIQEGTKTRDSRQIRRDMFAHGRIADGGGGAGLHVVHGARPVRVRCRTMIDAGRRRGAESDVPAGEIASLKANTAQALQRRRRRRSSSPTARSARRCSATHPYARTGATPETRDGDGSREDGRRSTRPLPAEQRVPRLSATSTPEAAIAAAEKAFGGWARGDVPAPPFAPPPPLTGGRWSSCSGPNSIQSSIAVGNLAIRARAIRAGSS